MTRNAWAGKTFGNAFMHRWLVKMLRHVDVRVFYLFVAVFIVPFSLVFSRGARTTWHYFRHRQRFDRWKSLRATYLNHVLFGQVVIDKFALYAGKQMALHIENYDLFLRLSRESEGFVILSAHIGCYEMAGYKLVSDSKPFNALVFADEKASIMENRTKLFSGNNIHMIPIATDHNHLFEIERALSNDEIVSIPADRVLGSRHVIPARLLGSLCSLPYGPFSIPAMRSLNVMTVNVMKTNCREYTAYCTALDYDKTAPRRVQAQQLADNYAAELERLLKRYPEQWYNYYEFWSSEQQGR